MGHFNKTIPNTMQNVSMHTRFFQLLKRYLKCIARGFFSPFGDSLNRKHYNTYSTYSVKTPINGQIFIKYLGISLFVFMINNSIQLTIAGR